ncbi:hypothetical protein ACWEM1_23050, partial [Streptomyces sp. NPDC004491]
RAVCSADTTRRRYAAGKQMLRILPATPWPVRSTPWSMKVGTVHGNPIAPRSASHAPCLLTFLQLVAW